MCGRYALALQPSQIRQMLEDGGMLVADAPEDESSEAPRRSYNFAPSYQGIVYRAATPDHGAGPYPTTPSGIGHKTKASEHTSNTKYKLQSMNWGLIPFWTKRRPAYSGMLKTINCRDDSLMNPSGMWTTMKARKRCIVIAEGFFEWLKKGPKDKLPHYVKRKDGQLMYFAGLWDCVQYNDDTDTKLFTYTIITTDSNPQLKFLHDRMPVVFDPGSDELWKWLDPERISWTADLQSLLKPYKGTLDVYPVSKDVGKVGNNSPTFVQPLYSQENKSNIANFFTESPATLPTKKRRGGSLSCDEQPVNKMRSKGVSSQDTSSRSATKNTLKKNVQDNSPQNTKITSFFSK